jgi:hypothetical protein
MKKIENYKEFYRYYLSEHQNRTCRSLHFTGTLLVFVMSFLAVYRSESFLWWFVPVVGYGFAWVGHYFFEKNRPATFTYPLWSLLSDFRMFFELLTGRISFGGSKEKE